MINVYSGLWMLLVMSLLIVRFTIVCEHHTQGIDNGVCVCVIRGTWRLGQCWRERYTTTTTTTALYHCVTGCHCRHTAHVSTGVQVKATTHNPSLLADIIVCHFGNQQCQTTMSAPVTHGPTLLVDNVGRQNNVKVTVVVGQQIQCWPTMTGCVSWP